MMDDGRPEVWVGHVGIASTDVKATAEWMERLGMRPLEQSDAFAILELRGGTHLIVLQADSVEPGTPASFDLMVEDIEATRKHYIERGLRPSDLEKGSPHSHFEIQVPGGIRIRINSTHVSDQPV